MVSTVGVVPMKLRRQNSDVLKLRHVDHTKVPLVHQLPPSREVLRVVDVRYVIQPNHPHMPVVKLLVPLNQGLRDTVVPNQPSFVEVLQPHTNILIQMQVPAADLPERHQLAFRVVPRLVTMEYRPSIY